ncbi:MAG: winged helix-turn-helix domain-containing protein [Gammaproteobacteria bacterium]|nr:winged helix-turn-helix domain-containing protein [Gammaproteobacteria bacterium]
MQIMQRRHKDVLCEIGATPRYEYFPTTAIISMLCVTTAGYTSETAVSAMTAYFDRLNTDEIAMTHEMMASLLGVRRVTVSAAAYKLQAAIVIRYSRGLIAVIDLKRSAYLACAYRFLVNAHVIFLAQFYPIVSQQCICSGHVEEKLWQRIAE